MSCGCRSRRTSTCASPMARSVSRSQSSVSGKLAARKRDATPWRIDLNAERCSKQQEDSTRCPCLRRARDRIERRILTTSTWEPANQLRQPVKIDGLAQIGHRRQDAAGRAGETVSRHAGGDDRVVVRPDRAVVIRLRVVASLAGGNRADAPAGKRRVLHQCSADARRALGRDDPRKQAMPGIGGAHTTRALVPIESQRVCAELVAPEGVLELHPQPLGARHPLVC